MRNVEAEMRDLFAKMRKTGAKYPELLEKIMGGQTHTWCQS